MATGWRPISAVEEPQLDRMLGSHPASGFMQSSFWADFKRMEGFEVTRLLYEMEDEAVGGASLLRYHRDGNPNFVLCPEGPCLPWESPELARHALRELVTLVKELPNALGLRIEPHLPRPLPSIIRNWSDSPTDLAPADTLMIDLSLSEEEVLARAHSKCRYNLKISEREGVEVVITQDLAYSREFYALLEETSFRTGFFVEPFGFFLNLMSVLFSRDAGQLFVARHDGKILAAILVVYFGRRATYLYGGSRSSNRNKMPTYPVHREAMRQARNRGCTEYDFYGIDAFERRDHLYAGITRFKKQWGGEVQQRIGARDYMFYDRLADLMVTRLEERTE